MPRSRQAEPASVRNPATEGPHPSRPSRAVRRHQSRVRSALIGHHFAGYSNRFWKLLHEAGLTPVLLRGRRRYAAARMGLRHHQPRSATTPGIDTLRPGEYVAGLRTLRRKVRKLPPGGRRVDRRHALSIDFRRARRHARGARPRNTTASKARTSSCSRTRAAAMRTTHTRRCWPHIGSSRFEVRN